MSEKTHFKKAFNSPYLGSQDLPDYKDINLVIDRVVLQESEGLKENSKFNIAYFTDVKVKPMLLNATNSKVLSKLAKSVYIEDWRNIEVTVTVKSVKAFGDIHDALRIREVTRKIKPLITENSKNWSKLVYRVYEGADRKLIEEHYTVSEEIWLKLTEQANEIHQLKLKENEQKG